MKQLPYASYKFVAKNGVTQFFKKRWMHSWMLTSLIADEFYPYDKFRIWRFLGAL